MSFCSENPEWFDEWLEREALNGRFGNEVQKLAEEGDFCSWEWWNRLDKDGKLGQEAKTAYCERFAP